MQRKTALTLGAAWMIGFFPAHAASLDARLQAGKQSYDLHCAACHGATGAGDGSATVWLFPKPRDFSAGDFKIRSTSPGSPPTDADLLQVITHGMPGSSMPAFSYLPEQELRELVEYVKHLTAYIDEDGNRVNHFEYATEVGLPMESIEVPPEPPVTLRSLTRGQEMYAQLQCNICHGDTGAGDGISAALLKDSWGFALPPRDFNTGGFRGGHTGRDLYLRIAAGMAGTPMPPYNDDVISPEDRWALVQYIQSLRRTDVAVNDMLPPADDTIRASRVSSLPRHPADPAWTTTEPARIRLNPIWAGFDYPLAVAVRAVHDGKRIAFLLQWRDDTFNGAPIRTEDFEDAVALQFALNSVAPFVGMGDADNPVNIWQWKAGWQQEMDGPRPDVDLIYASMYVDAYPETGILHRPAEAAGNLHAASRRASPVEVSNARGFGTVVPQSAKQQNVEGSGIWRDGHWQVVFVRTLTSRNRQDAQFARGKPVPVSFAVWDGTQRDRNGKKAISNWYQLVVE